MLKFDTIFSNFVSHIQVLVTSEVTIKKMLNGMRVLVLFTSYIIEKSFTHPGNSIVTTVLEDYRPTFVHIQCEAVIRISNAGA